MAESVDRRRRLQDAMRTAVAGEMITNADMMTIWGVTKGRWTDIRNRIPDFPTPIITGNSQLYAAVDSLKAMWAWEIRGDQIQAEKSKRVAAMLGMAEPTEGAMPTISDMQKASALRMEVETRMVRQRELVLRAEVQQLAARIGEFLSRRLGNLGAVLDPNGVWPPELRQAADTAGHDWLLHMHGEMRDMLVTDADASSTRSSRDRTQPGRTGVSSRGGQRG